MPLVSNQVQYSLLSRVPETSGLVEACSELGVQFIGYSPLCLGILSGAPAHRAPGATTSKPQAAAPARCCRYGLPLSAASCYVPIVSLSVRCMPTAALSPDDGAECVESRKVCASRPCFLQGSTASRGCRKDRGACSSALS